MYEQLLEKLAYVQKIENDNNKEEFIKVSTEVFDSVNIDEIFNLTKEVEKLKINTKNSDLHNFGIISGECMALRERAYEIENKLRTAFNICTHVYKLLRNLYALDSNAKTKDARLSEADLKLSYMVLKNSIIENAFNKSTTVRSILDKKADELSRKVTYWQLALDKDIRTIKHSDIESQEILKHITDFTPSQLTQSIGGS